MKRKSTNNFLLALTAFIWGSAFVAQSVGMDYLGPFTFNSIRCLMGGIVLIPELLLFKKKWQEEEPRTGGGSRGCGNWQPEGSDRRRYLLRACPRCGKLSPADRACIYDRWKGRIYYSAVHSNRSGYGILLGKRVRLKVWIGVVLAATGMYFLCITEGFSIAKGDFFVFLCAAAFSVHILVIDYFAPKVDGVALSCIQFFVCGILCAVPMLVSEQPQISQIMEAWVPLAYAGVLSCGVAYTLQVVAQKNTDPAVASLILSLESVFSVLAGWVILGERLSGRELFGCALVFTAVILAQFPEKAR